MLIFMADKYHKYVNCFVPTASFEEMKIFFIFSEVFNDYSTIFYRDVNLEHLFGRKVILFLETYFYKFCDTVKHEFYGILILRY